jgi:TRAP-type C4-dicarboxylate transport system substrate-binding protein
MKFGGGIRPKAMSKLPMSNSRVRAERPAVLMALLALAAGLGGLPNAAKAQDTVSLRLSYWGKERDPIFRRVLLPYTRAVRRATGGRVRIQLFPGGLLGRGRQNQFNMLSKGIADIVVAQPRDRLEIFRDEGLFATPGVIPNSVSGSVAAWQLVRSGNLAGFKQYHALALFLSAPHMLHMKNETTLTKHLIAKTIGAVPGPQYRFLRVLHAKGDVVALRRVTDAIDQQAIDGAFASATWLADAKADELLKHHVVFPAGATSIGLFMLPAKFRKLPAYARNALIAEGGAKLARIYGRLADKREEAQLARWQRDPTRTVTVLRGKAATPWIEAIRKGINRWRRASRRNARLLRMLQGAVRAAR